MNDPKFNKSMVLGGFTVWVMFMVFLLVNPAHADDVVLPQQFFDVKTRSIIPITDVIDKMHSHRYVLLGEHHDDKLHHEWQTAMVKSISKNNVVLALEMLTWDHIDTVNLWLDNKITDKSLSMVWNSAWGYDFEMYRPILQHAKDMGWGIAPMRVDDETNTMIIQHGITSIDNLKKPISPSRDYIDMLAWVSQNMHGGHKVDFNSFVRQQVIWDTTMAQVMMKQPIGATIIAIVGGGHLESGWGIPHQLRGFGETSILSLIPIAGPFKTTEVPPGYADILYRSK